MTSQPDPDVFIPRLSALTAALNSRFHSNRPDPQDIAGFEDEFGLSLGHVGVGASLHQLGDRIIALEPDHDALTVALVLREDLPGYNPYHYSLFVLAGDAEVRVPGELGVEAPVLHDDDGV